MRTITAVGLLAVTVTLTRADDASDAAKKLDGTYTVISGTVGGKKDDDKLKDITSVVIKDGSITVKTEKRDDEAKFTLDPSKKPAEINLTTARGKSDIPGIYETKQTDDGLQLTLAFVQGGDAARPKDFKGEGEKAVVLVLLRKKAK